MKRYFLKYTFMNTPCEMDTTSLFKFCQKLDEVANDRHVLPNSIDFWIKEEPQ